MQSIEIICHLFSYNHWANQRVLDSLKSHHTLYHKAIHAFSHLIIAEMTWLTRLLGNVDNTGFDFWPDNSIQEVELLADQTASAYREMLEELTEEGLDSKATYKNSKGIEYSTTLRDILMHVLMHSMYHRGQVAMAVRAEGGEPVNSDYVAFVREREMRK